MSRPHKYGAKATVVDGHRFPSKAEAKRYGELKLLARAGAVTGLRLQPRFPIVVNGIKVCDYVADFSYFEGINYVVEDTKGFRTPIYLLKKKLFEATYGYSITETGKGRVESLRADPEGKGVGT